MKNTEMTREGHDKDVKTRCQEDRQFSDSALSCFIQVTGISRFLLILLDPRSNVGKAVELSTTNFGHSRGTRCHLEPMEGDCSVDENLKSLDLEYVRLETLSIAPFSTCCSLTSRFLGSRISLEQKWWKQWMNSKHLSIYKHTHSNITYQLWCEQRPQKIFFRRCWIVTYSYLLLDSCNAMDPSAVLGVSEKANEEEATFKRETKQSVWL